MFTSYLYTALRNLARNKLQACINVAGLATAFTAAILIALYVRDELSYDRWLSGYERIYRVSAGSINNPTSGVAPSDVAGWLKADFPQIQAVTRLFPEGGALRHGEIESDENLMWADANVFDVLPFPAIAGDVKNALQQPDGIVLTRKLARKYFGRDDPIGETLELNRQYPFRVTAVIEDLPSNTHFRIDALVPGHASFSSAAKQESAPLLQFGHKVWNSNTYFRLSPNASIESIRQAMPGLLDRRVPSAESRRTSERYRLTVSPIADIHLGTLERVRSRANQAAGSALLAMEIIGLLIISVASINFINLMTARAARRAIEVGVRKAMGARRRDLVVQFVGESLMYVSIAMIFSLALVELLLPQLNAFLDRRITFNYWQEPWLATAVATSTLTIGMLAGLYPALVMSAFKPASVLKGTVTGISGAGITRQVLVILQFSVLIGLIVASVVVYRQNEYAMRESMRQNADQFLVLNSRCQETLKYEIAAVPGVSGAACSLQVPQFGLGSGTSVKLQDGKQSGLMYTAVDVGYFELYGFSPVAGRFFARERGTDLRSDSGASSFPEAIVVNETAVKEFGFASAQAAIGEIISWDHLLTISGTFTGIHEAEVIGVVPDFLFGSARNAIPAAGFYVEPMQFNRLNIKLSGQQIPETLANIERVWKKFGDARPFNPTFVDQHFRAMYRDLSQQTQLAGVAAGVAVFIACLGLFGLATFTAERRTKEIGIRKAMGAGTGEVMPLLLWQFTTPVLWANLIAWPVAAFFMNRWLHGFAYHIVLSPWIFVGATALALMIALSTVSVHCYHVARAKPIQALRYE